MTEDTQKILEELRIVRRLIIHLTAEVISMKSVVAVAGTPEGMTVEQVIKSMDETVRQVRNQILEYDVENDEES